MTETTTEMTLHGLSLDLTGWFQIGWSDELAEGDVLSKHYFGRDLVVYRGLDGTVVVQDRYCQHLGASLAHGGCVTDEGIQCPFHGWVWAPDGRNVSIPYQDRPNKARRLNTWPVTELNESIYIWNDSAGGPPTWQVADTRTFFSPGESTDFHVAGAEGRSFFPNLRVHPQMVVENAVDPHHFRFVHRTPISPVILKEEIDGTEWRARVGFGNRWAEQVASGEISASDSRNTIQLLWQGMGISANLEHTRDGLRAVAINTTPVDDQVTDMFATYWMSEHENDKVDGSFQRRLNEAMSAMPDDLKIWNNQIFLDPPALASSEGRGFRAMRRWTQQFFPENSQYTLRTRIPEHA
ncbi:MAG: kshA 1 [Pseudonocardiales bacterium]|nr:kshA 1 [Pseudonocardiales bacterium]